MRSALWAVGPQTLTGSLPLDAMPAHLGLGESPKGIWWRHALSADF
jgi:hypothetical protein